MQIVLEADRSGATCRDGDLLRIGAGAVILSAYAAVRVANLLNIVGAGEQAGDGDLTTGIGGMRSGYQGRTGGVRVDTELPAFYVLTILGSLGQTQIATIQLIGEAHRCGAVCTDRDSLGIGTGTIILGIDTAVRVTGFLYIVGARNQAGNRDLAAGIGGMRTGYYLLQSATMEMAFWIFFSLVSW